MNGWEFATSVIDILAWPVTVLIIASLGIRAWARSFEEDQDG